MATALAAAAELLERAVEESLIPSAAVLVGTPDKIHLRQAFGQTRYPETGGAPVKVSPQTRYDLASLTKVMATLPAILKLVDAGVLRFEDRVGTFFSHAGWFQSPSLAQVRIRDLLTHRSGLHAWKPLFAITNQREVAVANVLQSEVGEPGNFVYSDLGFIILGALVERLCKRRLDSFVQEEVFSPLDIKGLSFGVSESLEVAATEDCGWRGEVLQGVVHDENAYAMAGVAGHAGLFGCADDVAHYARAWLTLDERLASEELLREAVREQVSGDGERRGLAWQLKGRDSSIGRYASERAFGHTGFTGTSLWIDPELGWYAVLLTNRVHPTRHDGGHIHALRQRFYEQVARAFSEGAL